VSPVTLQKNVVADVQQNEVSEEVEEAIPLEQTDATSADESEEAIAPVEVATQIIKVGDYVRPLADTSAHKYLVGVEKREIWEVSETARPPGDFIVFVRPIGSNESGGWTWSADQFELVSPADIEKAIEKTKWQDPVLTVPQSFKVGDRVYWSECPAHCEEFAPFEIMSIDGDSAKLDLFSKPVPLGELFCG